jgi:hypothetical protein
MSASGRYIMAGGNLSTDFGDTFNQLPSPANFTTNITGMSISANGQYMVIAGLSTGCYSVDYGTTWVSRNSNGGNVTNGSCMAMPANASFVMQATSTGIYKYASLTVTDVSMNNALANFYTKTTIDSSLNDNFFNKTTTNSTFLAKSDFDSSMNNNYYTKTMVDTYLDSYALTSSLFSYATTTSLNDYYTKTTIDSSLNDNFFNKTTTNSTFLAKSDFDSSMNNNYYTKTTIDSSLNDNFFNKTTTNSTFLAKSAFDTSMNNNYYTKTMVDASLANYSTISYVDGRFTTLTGVAPSTLDTLAEIASAIQGDAGFGTAVYNRINSCDSSINTIRTSLADYTLKTAVDNSLNLYLRSGQTSDASLNGNVQLGDGARFMGINKLPNALFALDISGSTNISGNLSLTKAASVPMGSFDLSSVNMSVFNVSEKFTTVALNAGAPTLDYSTGGIFYISNVNAALSTISITNVPTTLNRSISVTLILAQSGGAGTNCFTTGTLNVNGTAITYLKPDATALAAPSASRTVIINQFIIIWVSAQPTVIAYLSSMG